MVESWAEASEHGDSKMPEFIPLGYNIEGRVVDVMGNIRNVEAIPYALDNVYISVELDSSPFEISREILGYFKSSIKGKLKKVFKKDLEGKVGFISGSNNYIEDPQGEGTWITVQLYRVKD